MTGTEAADILGRSAMPVQQLTDADRLPYVIHPRDGWRLYRRQQPHVISDAWRAMDGEDTHCQQGRCPR